MKLSIRLQQKGKKNHPYWWIVVAPNRRNMFGRYAEHVGIWCPREGVNIKRQIILNIPRVKYWISKGAVPTMKVHKFLSMWNMYPKLWYYKKTPEELAKIPKKPEEELTDKQKYLRERRRKRLQREQLNYNNYHSYEARAMRQKKIVKQIMAKQHAQDFENDIMREIMYSNDFQKFDRIADLADENKEFCTPLKKKIKELEKKIIKARTQLAFLEKQHKHSRTLQKVNLIKIINETSEKLSEVENSQQYSMSSMEEDPENPYDYITEDYLEKRLKYELITKRMEKTNEEITKFNTYNQIITLEEFAYHLKQEILIRYQAELQRKKEQGEDLEQLEQEIEPEQAQEEYVEDEQELKAKTPAQTQKDQIIDQFVRQQGLGFEETDFESKKFSNDLSQKQPKQIMIDDEWVYELAENIYKKRAEAGAPVTKLDILTTLDPDFAEEIMSGSQQREEFIGEDGSLAEQLEHARDQDIMKKFALSHNVYLPSLRPLHPRPDFKTYYPQEYYEPLEEQGTLELVKMDSLDPYEEVEKYHKKQKSKKTSQLI